MNDLNAEFVRTSAKSMLLSFVKDPTVSAFWLGVGRYAWRQLLVRDSLAWRQV